MAVSAAMLRRIASMSHEAAVEMLRALADQEEIDEERKAKQRERTAKSRAKRYGNVTVTDMSRDSNVTPPSKEGFPPAPPSQETQPLQKGPLKGSQKGSEIEIAFERFWTDYPRRKGSNPKHPASLRFLAAVKAGTDPEAIIAAAGRYRSAEGDLGHIDTPFVKQAVAWLNQRCWEDYAAPPSPTTGPPQPPDPSLPSHEELLKIYGNQRKPADGEDQERGDESLLRRGDGVDRAGEKSRSDRVRETAVAGVARLPHRANGHHPGGHEAGRESGQRQHDDADRMAPLVRHSRGSWDEAPAGFPAGALTGGAAPGERRFRAARQGDQGDEPFDENPEASPGRAHQQNARGFH